MIPLTPIHHFTHLTLPTIVLAVIVGVGLANIIISLIVFGGRLCPSAEPATEASIQKDALNKTPLSNLLGNTGGTIACDCRCHSETMFPGMRCLDCYGLDCDEGTYQPPPEDDARVI